MPSPHNPRRRVALGAATSLAAMIPLAATPGGSAHAAARPPTANAPDERLILDVLDDVYRRHRYLSVPPEDGRLLRVLAESGGARQVVEIGTSTGYSGLWLLLALARTGGRLTTYEIDPQRHALARANFERAGVSRFASLVLGDAHNEIAKLKDPIDLLFLDADKVGYLDYMKKLRALVRPGGLIVAHNMNSPPPDPAYVKAVTTDPALETIFLNMHDAGVGVTLKKIRGG